MSVRSCEIHALSTRIQLPVLCKLLSVMEGQYPVLRWGRGWEFMDLASYQPGDDVREIDWAATVRTGLPIIRRHKATANLQVMLVVDMGRGVGAFVSSGGSKEEVALTTCETIARLSVTRGDQIGPVVGDAERACFMPVRSGNAHAGTIMRHIEKDITLSSPHSDVPRLLARVRTVTRRRSLIVIVTDATQPESTRLSDDIIKSSSVRHQVIQVSVADMNSADTDQDKIVIDVSEGPLPDFLRRDEQLVREASTVVEQGRATVVHTLDMRGVIQMSVGSSEEVPRALLRALQRSGARR